MNNLIAYFRLLSVFDEIFPSRYMFIGFVIRLI